MSFITVNGISLPDPISLAIDDEIIWSSNTGRTGDATMVGDVVAEKKTITLEWQFLQESEVLKIKNNLVAGFYPITFHDDGEDITIQTYRGTLNKEQLGRLSDGYFWYRSVKVKLIQQ